MRSCCYRHTWEPLAWASGSTFYCVVVKCRRCENVEKDIVWFPASKDVYYGGAIGAMSEFRSRLRDETVALAFTYIEELPTPQPRI